MCKNKKYRGFKLHASSFKTLISSCSLQLAACSLVCSLQLAACSLIFAQDGFHYDDKGKRNPFIPLVTSGGRLLNLDQEEGVKALSLEGIIYDKHGQSYAIVNGSVVGTGDEVGEYRVVKIEEDRVVFIKEGEPLEIEMTKEEKR